MLRSLPAGAGACSPSSHSCSESPGPQGQTTWLCTAAGSARCSSHSGGCGWAPHRREGACLLSTVWDCKGTGASLGPCRDRRAAGPAFRAGLGAFSSWPGPDWARREPEHEPGGGTENSDIRKQWGESGVRSAAPSSPAEPPQCAVCPGVAEEDPLTWLTVFCSIAQSQESGSSSVT